MRLWHACEKGLIELAKQNLLNDDEIEKLKFCDDNISRFFEYAHFDLWGSCRTKTQANCSYFLFTIDDYFKKVWIYAI